ncbi:Kinesin-like protein KIF21B [Operophtera brumata]|uniref:Kinesin-like protein KIF21B n=1 Tax=Operophtera brumata TaxID=104452 RepID=A0A0L7LBV5_OPEBR|nr:Kinesin-like protein KIF21B [Operophtera brumata]
MPVFEALQIILLQIITEKQKKIQLISISLCRIRPQTPGEVVEGCGICARAGGAAGEGGVALGTERAFTFDYAFEPSVMQQEVYETSVRKLVEAALDGYNATVLAYGQVRLIS